MLTRRREAKRPMTVIGILSVSLCASLWFVTGLAETLLAGSAYAQSNDEPTGSDAKACAALAGDGKLPWSVNSAGFVQPPFTAYVAVGPRDKWKRVTVSVPFCRIVGTVKPTPESDIRFELWLPPRADWNGKFEGVGSGASLGTIQYPALMRALVRGYATAATDNGHQSEAGSMRVGRWVNRNALLTSATARSTW